MKHSFKLLSRVLGTTAIFLASHGAHAECDTVGTTGVLGFKMAVASNFYLSAKERAGAFQAGKTYDILICEGSSGDLYNEIVPDNEPQYALFMSADTARPADLAGTPLAIGNAVTYAKGTPVFLLSPIVYTASTAAYPARDYLNQGLLSGATAESSIPGTTVTNDVSIKRPPATPSVNFLAIGDPAKAPYGAAAQLILSAMGFGGSSVFSAGGSYNTPCSTLVGTGQWICSYNNINITLDAINANSVTAGFVSYGQVCPTLTSSSYPAGQYVLFPDYPTTQAYILLNVTDTTAETKAAAFISFLGIGTTSWNTWLTDHCYQEL
ncbi:MAG: substrate-binding domain-containing protein [Azoarcus sp.]|jgi:ABC-type molybdate transport system substrate-binding protein|nr:substrate-binding domain-containing protein [Azoarcus sp.]